MACCLRAPAADARLRRRLHAHHVWVGLRVVEAQPHFHRVCADACVRPRMQARAAAAHLASTSRPARCPQRRHGSTRSCTAARAGPPTAGPANARRLVCEQGGVQGATTRHGVEGSLEKLECSHPLSCRVRLLALHQRVGRLRQMNVQRERGARARPARKCAPALQAPHGPQPLRALARVRGGARSRGGRGAAVSRTAAAAQQQPGAAPARVAGAAARRGMPSARRHQPERS